MLVNKLIWIFTFILFSQASFGGLTHREVLKKYSLEQLDSVANLLMYATDLAIDGKKNQNEVCRLNKDESLAYINKVKALIDSKFKNLKKRIPASWENCEVECHCSVYARFGEGLDVAKLFSKDKNRLKLIEKKAADQTPAKLKSCVAKTQWFCRSPLLEYLKND